MELDQINDFIQALVPTALDQNTFKFPLTELLNFHHEIGITFFE